MDQNSYKDKKIKIAYFIAEYKTFSGSHKGLLLEIKNMPENIDIEVIFPGRGRAEEIYRKNKIKTKIIEGSKELNKSGKYHLKLSPIGKIKLFTKEIIPYSNKLSEYLTKNDFQIICFNSTKGILMSLLAGRKSKIPSLLYLRGKSRQAIGFPLAFIANSFADHIIIISKSIKKEILFFHKKKTNIVHTLIEENNINTKYKSNSKKLTFLIPNSLVPFKGYHHLLKAIAIVNKNPNPGNIEFIAIGESPNKEYKRYIENLQKSLYIKNFKFLGWKNNPSKYFKSADAIILPSVDSEKLDINGKRIKISGNEGLPEVIIESFSFGKPVIASNIAGIPEEIDNEINGILIPPGDVNALAKAIEKLAKNPELRRFMGKNAKDKTKVFSKEKVIPQTVEIYYNLIYK